MGKLVTKGEAEREYAAERMELTVRFTKYGDDARYILGSVQEQCEQFLRALSEIGIDPEQVILKDEGLSKSYRDEQPIEASREITLETDLNKELYAYICDLIKRSEKKIRYSVSYTLKEEENERRNRELLREAVKDARRQADIIAESLGCKVTGVDSINEKRYISSGFLAGSAPAAEERERGIVLPEDWESGTPLTDRAAVPKVSLSEDIVIAWKMEECPN